LGRGTSWKRRGLEIWDEPWETLRERSWAHSRVCSSLCWFLEIHLLHHVFMCIPPTLDLSHSPCSCSFFF
jgi:hypothetical protein